MIRPQDVRFHVPNDIQYDWAETSFFSIYLPEANVTAWTYVVARIGVGAIACDVEAIDRIGRVSLDALYIDFQQHLPVPERFEAFTLPNGFSLKTMNEPRDYLIDYVGSGDTAFHWAVKGLMEPFDIHDATMDPLASHDPNASGFGSAYANHFDMTAHVVGTATIRGKRYDVDCVTTMDHSWGPRNERGADADAMAEPAARAVAPRTVTARLFNLGATKVVPSWGGGYIAAWFPCVAALTSSPLCVTIVQ
jgi:hypothetical protein